MNILIMIYLIGLTPGLLLAIHYKNHVSPDAGGEATFINTLLWPLLIPFYAIRVWNNIAHGNPEGR